MSDHYFNHVAVLTGRVANYCDHQEHCEHVERDWVIVPVRGFTELAFRLSSRAGLDLWALMEVIETYTWRQFQLELIAMDRLTRPDVFGRSRYEQLRVLSIEATRLLGSYGNLLMNQEGSLRLIAWGYLLLGVRLATVMFEKLPEESIG